MNSTIDTATGLTPASARFERQHADTRQQRWMAQLDQAMLAQQAPDPQRAPAPARERDDTEKKERAQSAAGGPAAPPAIERTERLAALAAAHGAAPTLAAQGAAGPARDGGAAPGELQAVRRAAPAGRATPTGTVGAPPAWAAPAPGLAAATPGPALAGLAARPSGAVLAAAPAPDSTPPVAPALARTGMAGMAGQAGMDREAALAPDASALEADAPAASGADEEYHKQLLHLFHGKDGVQAWIRDAELGGARLRAVAQALAAELHGSGARLASLTVNGRRIVANGADLEAHAPATASGADSQPPVTQKGAI